jgi:hypothetical protein
LPFIKGSAPAQTTPCTIASVELPKLGETPAVSVEAKPEAKPAAKQEVKPDVKKEPEKKNWLQRIFN